MTSSLAQQFCRPHSCCPSKHKEKRVGQKKREDGNEKDLNRGKRRLRNLKEKKIAVLYLNVPPHYSLCPCQLHFYSTQTLLRITVQIFTFTYFVCDPQTCLFLHILYLHSSLYKRFCVLNLQSAITYFEIFGFLFTFSKAKL